MNGSVAMNEEITQGHVVMERMTMFMCMCMCGNIGPGYAAIVLCVHVYVLLYTRSAHTYKQALLTIRGFGQADMRMHLVNNGTK